MLLILVNFTAHLPQVQNVFKNVVLQGFCLVVQFLKGINIKNF